MPFLAAGVMSALATLSSAQPAAPTETDTRPEVNSAVYPTAAVAADHELASLAGLEMLKAGGNAVDAAVATSFALSVVRPYSCGIGGGGFMVVHLREHPRTGPIDITIDYRETAPGAISPRFFESDPEPDSPTHGGKSVGVPGTVAGLLHALDTYGTLDRRTVLAPAIRLAREGFVADAHYIESTQNDELVVPWLRKDPARRARFEFLWKRYLIEGAVRLGDHLRVPEQARVLELIAEQGADAFYRGPVAQAMVGTIRRDGGVMTLDDVASYKPVERAPLTSSFRGMKIITMPPPSSGGIVFAQVFGMLERRGDLLDGLRARGMHNSAPYIHLVAEAQKHAFADRARWMADPAFAHVPVKGLLSPAYLDARGALIDPARTLLPEAYGSGKSPPDDAGTSHLCVIDRWGNGVACTETVNLIFGSLLVVPEYGFVLNDTIDDFLTRAGHANAFGLDHADLNRPEPGKRPLSSMTPTIVLAPEGDVSLIAGGAGGPRIISGTIQAALNVLVWDMPADKAVALPRFHHQWHPDTLDLEDPLREGGLPTQLRELGHNTSRRKAVGTIQIIRRMPGGWQPASDPRKGGVPAGY